MYKLARMEKNLPWNTFFQFWNTFFFFFLFEKWWGWHQCVSRWEMSSGWRVDSQFKKNNDEDNNNNNNNDTTTVTTMTRLWISLWNHYTPVLKDNNTNTLISDSFCGNSFWSKLRPEIPHIGNGHTHTHTRIQIEIHKYIEMSNEVLARFLF